MVQRATREEILRVTAQLRNLTEETHEVINAIRRRRDADPWPPVAAHPLRGTRAYRIPREKYEQLATELWERHNTSYRLLACLLSDDDRAPGTVADRDQVVAATLMQWLGSNVGRAFLRELIAAFKAASDGRW